MQKCRLLILCTCANKAVINDLELATAFSTVLHVPPIMSGADVCSVLNSLEGAFTPREVQQLEQKIGQLKYARAIVFRHVRFDVMQTCALRCYIGVKKLLDLVDLVKQTDEGYRVPKFLCKMEEEGDLEPT